MSSISSTSATLADDLPDLPMVIDHLAKPRIKDHAIDDWLPQLPRRRAVSERLLQALGDGHRGRPGNWTADDLKPYVQAALDAFGPDRLMFGSDWPVCELAASYLEVFEARPGHRAA